MFRIVNRSMWHTCTRVWHRPLWSGYANPIWGISWIYSTTNFSKYHKIIISKKKYLFPLKKRSVDHRHSFYHKQLKPTALFITREMTCPLRELTNQWNHTNSTFTFNWTNQIYFYFRVNKCHVCDCVTRKVLHCLTCNRMSGHTHKR